jgi:uncharacterized membrane protein
MSWHQALLALHLIFIATGLGMSFSNFINTRLSLGKTGDMAKGLGLQRRAVAQIGDGVIAGIWITGLALWSMLGMASPNGWFHTKLAFVVLLTVSHILARRTGGVMLREGKAELMPRLSLFIGGVWISAIIAVVLAVLAFEA